MNNEEGLFFNEFCYSFTQELFYQANTSTCKISDWSEYLSFQPVFMETSSSIVLSVLYQPQFPPAQFKHIKYRTTIINPW